MIDKNYRFLNVLIMNLMYRIWMTHLIILILKKVVSSNSTEKNDSGSLAGWVREI